MGGQQSREPLTEGDADDLSASASASSRQRRGSTRLVVDHVIRRQEGARTFGFSVVVRVGTQSTAHGEAELLRQLLPMGTAAYPHKDSVELTLDSISSTLTSECADAYTRYTVHTPRAHAPMACRVMAEILRFPLLQEDLFDVERMIWRENVGNAVAERWVRQRPPVDEAAVSSVADLRQLWKRTYDLRNMSFVVCGDWEGGDDALIRWLTHYFGESARLQGDSSDAASRTRSKLLGQHGTPQLKALPHLPAVPLMGRIQFIPNREKLVHRVTLCYPLKAPYASLERYACEVLVDMLGGSMSSRLRRRARECRAWAQAIEARGIFEGAGQWLVVDVTTTPSSTLKTVASIVRALASFWKVMTVEEMRQSQARLAGQLDMLGESPKEMSAFVARQKALGCAEQSLEDAAARYARVRLEQVREVARSALEAQKMRLAHVGNKPVFPAQWTAEQTADSESLSSA